jgi:hypothetical protein
VTFTLRGPRFESAVRALSIAAATLPLFAIEPVA